MTKERYKVKVSVEGGYWIVYGKMELVIAVVPSHIRNDKEVAHEIATLLNENQAALIPLV